MTIAQIRPDDVLNENLKMLLIRAVNPLYRPNTYIDQRLPPENTLITATPKKTKPKIVRNFIAPPPKNPVFSRPSVRRKLDSTATDVKEEEKYIKTAKRRLKVKQEDEEKSGYIEVSDSDEDD